MTLYEKLKHSNLFTRKPKQKLERKYTTKKALSVETFVFPVIFFGIIIYLAATMGMANMINTVMATSFDLLINTVFYIMAVCVIMGALSELLSEFGFVTLMDRILRPLMKPLFGLPGAASLGMVSTFLSDNPAILALAGNSNFKSFFKAYQFPALTNLGTSYGMGLIVCTYMLSLSTITGHSYGIAVVVGLLSATIGAVVSTRIMLIFTKRVYGKEMTALEAFPSAEDKEVGAVAPGMRPVRVGGVGSRILGAALDGGMSGARLGTSIIPGVLVICTLVMLLMNGAADSGAYTGAAYEGVSLIPKIAKKLDFALKPLFGFSSTNAVGVPITALGAAGAALGLTSEMARSGLITGGDIAVFTAMCMCWSGYLSTHTSMMDSLHCKELTGKAILSHTVGGIMAGISAHWLYKLFILIWG